MVYDLNTWLQVTTLVTGLVGLFQLAEYIFTRNLPWLVRLVLLGWRRLRLWWRRRQRNDEQRYLAVNFSAHPLLPGQLQEIQKKMGWPKVTEIAVKSGSVPETQRFGLLALQVVEQIDLTHEEWQSLPLVVIPAGYASLWSLLLAELHGRMGHFPDLVRLRPANKEADERFEVAEIIRLQDARNQARAKRTR